MQVQVLLRGAGVAAILAHVQFVSPLFVGVLLLHSMNLLEVGFQGTPLGKCFVANLTFVRTNSGVGPDVALQIKGVVEALPAEGAQVPLHLAVALDVPVQHALQAEALATQLAGVHCGIGAGARGELGNGRDRVSALRARQRPTGTKSEREGLARCGTWLSGRGGDGLRAGRDGLSGLS